MSSGDALLVYFIGTLVGDFGFGTTAMACHYELEKREFSR